MARTMIVAIALALPLLAGCKGFYAAGDGGGHASNLNVSPTAAQKAPYVASR
jgi:hypothetical protein